MSEAASSDTDHLLDLIERARGGCGEAAGILIESFRPMMLQVAGREMDAGLKQKVGASDVVQEACFDAARSIPRFRGHSEQQWLSWLMEILRNNLSNCRRRYETEKRNRLLEKQSALSCTECHVASQLSVPASETPSRRLVNRETFQQLDDALRKLSIMEQQVVRMHNRDQMTFEFIGREIGKSKEATRKIWARAIIQLQGWITEQDSQYRDRL
jgi:RNA polymerase sigma-70 factor (ECF subfamily)